MLADLARETRRSLRAHALRYTLTSLGIVWGAFMLTYLSASMEGTERHFMGAMQKMGPRIVFTGGGVVMKQRVGERGARPVELKAADSLRMSSLSTVEAASPRIELWSEMVRYGRRTKLLQIEGVSESADTIRNYHVAEGRFLSPIDVERAERVAFLGADAAVRVFGGEPALGRRIEIGGTSFRVVGVAARKGMQLVDSLSPDDRKVLIPYTTAQRILTQTDKIAEFTYSPVSAELSSESVRRVRELTAPHHGFDPKLETAMWFFDIQEVLQLVGGLLAAMRLFNVVAGLTTLLVGAVGVMNIMLVIVGERRAEIGLRKAIGATGRAIFVQFLAESTAVCLASGLVGAALGIALAQLVAHLAPASPFASTPVLDLKTVVTLTSALVLVGIVAGVAPAWRAAQVPPAEALRGV
ncbi:MAG TPA: ABC transporter permease [Myxococcota bacterium]|nr:ABC transporter permease [Myxococcota bacterium]